MQEQALRIDENMPLLALDELARVETGRVDAGPLFRRFSRSGCR